METSTWGPVAIGVLASLVFQVAKGSGWNPWLLRVLALGSGFGAGFGVGEVTDTSGTVSGIHASTAALATYAVAFQGTKLGDQLGKMHWLPKLATEGSKFLAGLAAAIGNEDEKKPPTPGGT